MTQSDVCHSRRRHFLDIRHEPPSRYSGSESYSSDRRIGGWVLGRIELLDELEIEHSLVDTFSGSTRQLADSLSPSR